MDLFLEASRRKLRFTTSKGVASVEDLWVLPLKNAGLCLDAIAIELHNKLEATGKISFVTEVKADDTLQLQFDIVKKIIDIRLEERKAADDAQKRRALKDKISEILAHKQDAAWNEKSVEELQAELAKL